MFKILKSRSVLAVTTAVVAVVTAIFFTRGSDENVIDLGDASLRYDATTSDLIEIQELSRGALTSTFLRMRLVSDDPQTEFSFGLVTANQKGQEPVALDSSRRLYFGDCTYEDGPGDFQRLVGDGRCNSSPQRDSYHFKPGDSETVIVRCNASSFQQCTMSLYHEIGPYQVLVNAAILENRPEDWLTIADKVRDFIRNHMTHIP